MKKEEDDGANFERHSEVCLEFDLILRLARNANVIPRPTVGTSNYKQFAWAVGISP